MYPLSLQTYKKYDCGGSSAPSISPQQAKGLLGFAHPEVPVHVLQEADYLHYISTLCKERLWPARSSFCPTQDPRSHRPP